MDYVLWPLLFIGHLAIWCVVFNRVHATAFPRSQRKLAEKAIIFFVLFGWLWASFSVVYLHTFSPIVIAKAHFANAIYIVLCGLAGVYFTLRWVYRKFFAPNHGAIVNRRTDVIDVRSETDTPIYLGPLAKLLERIPGNQSHLIAIENITFALPNLPKPLEGMKVCHLSDFHLTGDIDIEYFRRVAKEVNEFDADFVFITGDLIDEAKCLDWIGEVFGSLKSRNGVFYVLGNHDLRIRDEPLLRKMLSDVGLVPVNGQWLVREVNGQQIAIAGNELPWFRGAEKLRPFETDDSQSPFKVLLSHSPDQLEWARKLDFDFMLAGHTHGGQIQLPIIGPIVAPSRYGIKYASGTFMIDKMLMHVSRGISGDDCIRISCKPEVGFFTLTRKS